MKRGTIFKISGAIILCISILCLIPYVILNPLGLFVVGFVGLVLLIVGFSEKSASMSEKRNIRA